MYMQATEVVLKYKKTSLGSKLLELARVMYFTILLGYSYKYMYLTLVSKPLRLLYSYFQLHTHGTDVHVSLFSLYSLNA